MTEIKENELTPKRIAIISDLHCGHIYGLTPPAWQQYVFQKHFWAWFSKEAKASKAEIVIVNGDAIEGKGARNGGIELITSDRMEQGKMAVECINQFKSAKKFYLTYGTPYHTGPDEHFEKPISDAVGGHIENRLSLNINGLLFDVRHHVSGSSTPYAHITPLKKEQVIALLDTRITRGSITVRSHVHKFLSIEDNKGMALTTPGLQIYTDFGASKCNGEIDLGFLIFDVKSKKEWSCKKRLLDVQMFRSDPIKV